ncbi:LAFA_0E07426g1_1 [Lachancea sp. 'fantastica']|nr:LAFA_0E07426g1_1 [Lachancea sp. 'fantastica']
MGDIAGAACVADTEAEESEEVIWRPDRQENLLNERPSMVERSQERGTEEGIRERREIATQRFRSFRKRTAIQKNPYKLDRIRHKQLLKGFEFQKESADQKSKERYDEWNDADNILSQDAEWQEGVGNAQEPELEDTYSKASPVRECESISEDEGPVYYRGKHVSLQTGFRGILPRVMWKRALEDDRKSEPTRFQRSKKEGKGIAKRKVTNKRHGLANSSLDDKLFLADDLVGSESEAIMGNFDLEKLDNEYMETLGNQLEDKYGNSYAFDDLSDDAELPDSEVRTFLTQEDVKTYSTQKRLSQPGVPSLSSKSSDSDLEIIEERQRSMKGADNIIDAMLSARGRDGQSRETRKQRAALPQNVRQSNGSKAPDKNKRRRKLVNSISSGGGTRSRKSKYSVLKRSVRRSHTAHSGTIIARPPDSIQPDLVDQSERSDATKAVMKKKELSIDSLERFVFSSTKVRVPTFDTAVEEEGDRFTIIKKVGKNNGNIAPARTETTDHSEPSSTAQSPLMSVLCGDKPAGPQSVDFTLSGKPYRISMYDTNLASSLEAMFHHIVEKGGSDSEIYSMNNLIVPLLSQLDAPGLWAVVDNFHRTFRSKANLLRNRAKPIHFYQIAACLVMLNEIRCYSSVSKLLAAEIMNKILDHIVSFFKLVSKSHLTNLDDDLLKESYALMATLIKEANKGQELWDRIRALSFPSNVALIILREFPSGETCWQMAEIEPSYEGAHDWIQLIFFSVAHRNWHADGILIQKFYDFYKARKFQNFPEEKSIESKPLLIGAPTWGKSAKTVFNVFIDLIASCQLSAVQMERITPIGQIVSLHSPGLLANRINLLLVLAEHAESSYEQKLEDLCYPYIEANNEKVLDLEGTFELILTGFWCLLRVNASKNLTTKAKIAFLALQQIVRYRGTNVARILGEFFKRLYSIAPSLGKSMPFVLKSLYPALMFLIKVKEKVELVPLLKFFGQNLHLLDVTWVMTHLHQVFSDLADDDDHLFQFYFIITKLLASRKVITWWSVLNYNNILNASKKHYVRFCTLVVQNCDEHSFLQIRHKLLQTVVDVLFEPVDIVFVKFLKALSRRDSEFEVHGNLSYLASSLEVATGALSAFKKVKDHSYMESLVTKLKDQLLFKPASKPLVMVLTNILNLNFVDIMKTNPNFLHLKSQFNISDTETQKSVFREILSSQKGELERALFIEEEFLKIAIQGSSLSLFLEKLESSMGANIFFNDYLFFCQLIEANASMEGESRTEVQWFVLLTLVRFVNRHLDRYHSQINSADFSALYQLHSYICSTHRWSHMRSFISSCEGEFYYEISLFFMRNLFISSGFIEYEILTAKCRSFLGNTAPLVHRSGDDASFYPVKRLLQKYGPSIHSNFHKTTDCSDLQNATKECHTKLSALLQ